MHQKVVVFLDYQNAYCSARERVCIPRDPAKGLRASDGNVDPLRLGQLIVSRGIGDRELAEVRVYMGMPDASRDPKGYAAASRQIAKQAQYGRGKVVHITRALRYPPANSKQKPQQKGVDVALALDFTLMAARGEYDVGVIMSGDTDLRPAIEAVLSSPGPPAVEVAAWGTPDGGFSRLSVPTTDVWCHWLDEIAFAAVADRTNYTLPAQTSDVGTWKRS
jgi:uncharacterized LabA/DUF88 family protein